MFPALPSASWSLDQLNALAQKTNEVTHFQPAAGAQPTDEMPDFPAGYNYFGQFIDHDTTLDDRPNDLTTPVPPAGLTNARTATLDLDSLYTGDSRAYEADGRFKLGAPLTAAESDHGARDLFRDAAGQAIIGDPRNDENKVVASFHSIMTRFHNKVYDVIRRSNPTWTNQQVFDATKQQVTYYYQWAVLTDFLPKIVGSSELAQVVSRGAAGWTTNLKFYDSCNGTMPVEFSGASYRFGHSLVRNDYEINEKHADLPVFTADAAPAKSLIGFGPSPSDFAIDWKYFLKLPERTGTTPQDAYQFDNSLVPALRLIPGPAAGNQSTILATRNLLRGQQLGLPSGQDVARAMGVTPLPDSKILVGLLKADPASVLNNPGWTPDLRATGTAGKFTISDIVRIGTGLGPVGVNDAYVDKADGYVNVGKAFVLLPILKSFTVYNRSAATVKLGAASYSGPSSMKIWSTTCGGLVKSLSPGGQCTVTVQYWPLARGAVTGKVSVPTDGATGTVVADLKASTF